jgi:hypothetical protein
MKMVKKTKTQGMRKKKGGKDGWKKEKKRISTQIEQRINAKNKTKQNKIVGKKE